jgi:hypothetical protein
MRFSILAGLAVLVPIAGSPGEAMAQAAGVTVMHGAKSENVSLGRDGVAPAIVRGEGPAAAKAARAHRPAGLRIAAAGGDVLWVIDRATGDVTACARGGNGMVGGRMIRCTDGTLR